MTAAAVERAAIAWHDRGQSRRMDADRKRPDGLLWQWDDLTEDGKHALRVLVAPIVTAALDDLPKKIAVLIVEYDDNGGLEFYGYRFADDLRDLLVVGQ